MAKVSNELLAEAFIKPIRFALLIDDQFPTFSELTDNQFNPNLDNARARALFALCRGKGWLCDVGNRPAIAENFENDNHLHQSDLLILDYNLDPNDQNDPTAALGIIQKLASSDHFNLVIVYTNADSRAVTRDIAYSLGAGKDLSPDNFEDAKLAVEDLDPEELGPLNENFSQTIIDDYIIGPSISSSKSFRDRLRSCGVAAKTIPLVLTYWTRASLEAGLKPEILADRRSDRQIATSLGSQEGPFWVTRDNVFVAVVNKGDNAPEVLIDRLESAIEAWNPNPLLVVMMHARASLEKAGTLADHKILETDRLRAGWLLRILLGKTAEDRRSNVADLYSRLFERLAASVEPSIVDFGSRLIRPVTGEEVVDTARAMARAPQAMAAEHIYHALNEYLCSDACPDGGMTTGVVFRAMKEGKFEYWLCVTPACDLVDGQNEGGWDGDLHPTRPVAVARLRIVKTLAAVTNLLHGATIGRTIFLYVDKAPVAFEVADKDSRQMSLETIFLRDGGRITSGKFMGHVIKLGADGHPEVNELEFEALAKLRPDYANRLLTQSGSQRARIGVDFYNLPVPTKESD